MGGCGQAEIAVILELIKRRLCKECSECCDKIVSTIEPVREHGFEENWDTSRPLMFSLFLSQENYALV